MFNKLTNRLLNVTLEIFFWVVLWRLGVPLNYVIAGVCTTQITARLYSLEKTIRTASSVMMKEQLLQTRVLSKGFSVNELETVNELKTELKTAAEKVYAANQ